MAEALGLLLESTFSEGKEVPREGPCSWTLCSDSVTLSFAPIATTTELSVSGQGLPQPIKPGEAWASSPAQSPQEVGTDYGVNTCTELVAMVVGNSPSSPVPL